MLKIFQITKNKYFKGDIQMILMIKFLKKILGKKEVLLILFIKIINLIKVVKVDKTKVFNKIAYKNWQLFHNTVGILKVNKVQDDL